MSATQRPNHPVRFRQSALSVAAQIARRNLERARASGDVRTLARASRRHAQATELARRCGQ